MNSRELQAIIRELPEGRKQSLREEIHARTTINKFLGRNINCAALAYAMDLLDGKTPTPLRHNNPVHRNGKVVIINAGKTNSQ